MADEPLSLPEIQRKLEEMFRYTSGIALGEDVKFVADTRIAAAQTSAHLAGMLMSIQELNLVFGLSDPGPGGLDLDPSASHGDPDDLDQDDGLKLDEPWESEPE
ncbi:MAG: hypothetical protein WD940_02195 [Patescibacteria group bacterium]